MFYLIFHLLLEPVKRVASAVLYPLAYALRFHAREGSILWPGYLFHPDRVWVWVFLDDSVFMEFKKEYADKPKYYPAFIWNTGSNFIRAYWWSAIRNSCVNLNNYLAFKLGEMVSEEPHDGKNFYVTRTFASGGKRPYCEFYLFGRWNQVGWIKKGRFEVDVMKMRDAK